VLALALAAACADHEQPAERQGPVTYQRDVRPVIEASCLPCHETDGSAPFALDSWDKVRALDTVIERAVVSGAMPPFPADPACRPLHDPAALSPNTRALFSAWRAAGSLEGDESAYVAPSRHAAFSRGEPELVLHPDSAYTPPAQRDEYRCFVLGKLASDTYLRALEIAPERRRQVHHAQLHVLTPAQQSAVEALDDAEPGLGYACPTGSGVGSQLLYSYRPGSGATVFADGDAAFVARDRSLLLQVHYNTELPDGAAPLPDQTKVLLWTLAAGELPTHVMYRTGATASIDLPAGAAQVVSSADSPLYMLSSFGSFSGFGGTFLAGELVGIAPHAHHLATRLSARLTHADGRQACLIDVPRWDFHAQLDYRFARAEPYGADDRLQIRCEYDNSAAHQPAVSGVVQAPRDVVWGERASDEMCLFYLWLRFERGAFLRALALGAPP